MKTDDLIRVLAADTMPAPPLARSVTFGMAAGVAVAVAALVLGLGVRPDLGQALGNPWSLMRWVVTGALGLMAVRVVLVLARPDGWGKARLWPLLGVAGLAVGLLGAAYATTPAAGRAAVGLSDAAWFCVGAIAVLSVLPVTGLLWALRQGATTVPALTGAMAGLAGAGAAAAVYAAHCTEDSPLFYVPAYALAICGVAAVSAIIGARVLRW